MIRETKQSIGRRAVVIGGSAGSIPVIGMILSMLPSELPVPVIICIHRMKSVAEGIRDVFAASTSIPVIEPNDKDPVLNGHIYLAPSNYHLLIENDMTFSLSTDSLCNYSRPSIDLTFFSASEVYKNELAGIILTGANKDGAKGLSEIKMNGGITIVQDPKTCVAPFMPLAAIECTKVDYILPVEAIANFISVFSL